MESIALQSSPRHATPLAPAYGEIKLGDVFIGSKLPPPNREVTPDRLLPAARVVAEIEALRARGVRVIALALDTCGGGDVGESLAIYRALRAFSDTGGTTIAHVRCVAASTAVALAVGCDVVVMEPGSRLDVHSMAAGYHPHHDGNRAMLAIFEARTPTPRSTLEAWTSLHYLWSPAGRHFVMLSAAETVQIGWADFVGDRAMVERLASELARYGSRPQTPRSVWLSRLALAAAATIACGEAAEGYRPNAKDPINAIAGLTGDQLAFGTVDAPNLAGGAVGAPALVQPVWITPTLNAGWTGTVQYTKDSLGWVTLRGYGTTVAPGTYATAFTLGVGYRPSTDRWFPVPLFGGATDTVNLFVPQSGAVTPGTSQPVGRTLYFDTISFAGEQ